MRAAVLTELNAPLTLADVETTPLQFGQVLVQIVASGICGAQLAEIRGEKGNAKFLPHLLGHEACGLVVEIGAGVTRVKPGERVVCHWRKARGIEAPFPQYRFNGRKITSGPVTTFSQFSIISENRLTPVPMDTPRELCALLGCGLSTALATVERDAAVKFGEGVMIVGMGGLGMNLLQAAKLAQASPIVCVDVHESKRELAEAMGADAYINAATENIPLELGKICRCGCDVIIDTAGSKRSIEATLPHLAPSGRFVLVGQPKPGDDVTIANANLLFSGKGKTIRATQGGGFDPDEDIPRYLKLWRAGKLKLDGIITHRVPLERINNGIDLVRNGQASRVLVEMF